MLLCLENACESVSIKGEALQSLAVTWHPRLQKRGGKRERLLCNSKRGGTRVRKGQEEREKRMNEERVNKRREGRTNLGTNRTLL